MHGQSVYVEDAMMHGQSVSVEEAMMYGYTALVEEVTMHEQAVSVEEMMMHWQSAQVKQVMMLVMMVLVKRVIMGNTQWQSYAVATQKTTFVVQKTIGTSATISIDMWDLLKNHCRILIKLVCGVDLALLEEIELMLEEIGLLLGQRLNIVEVQTEVIIKCGIRSI